MRVQIFSHQFGEKITLANGSTTDGLRIPYLNHGIKDPIVQVYTHLGNNEYKTDLAFVLLLSNNDIFISSEPFDGIVIIK